MTGNPYMPPAKTSEWATPQALFDLLNSEFHFTLDPCATNENHKCEKYFTKTEDGLTKNWGGGRQCSAIRLTGEGFRPGWRKPAKKKTARLLCFFLRKPTQNGFTITFTRKRKSDLSAAGCITTMQKIQHRFRQ